MRKLYISSHDLLAIIFTNSAQQTDDVSLIGNLKGLRVYTQGLYTPWVRKQADVILRAVYPYLPLATNAPRTIWGDFIKSLQLSIYKNPYNNCCQMSFSVLKYTKIDVGWGFAPDPIGELTALPKPTSWFQQGRFAAGGEWREGREGLGGGEEGNGGERGMEKKGGKGKLGE